MNIPFDIGSGTGPVIFEPIRTMEVSESVPVALRARAVRGRGALATPTEGRNHCTRGCTPLLRVLAVCTRGRVPLPTPTPASTRASQAWQ